MNVVIYACDHLSGDSYEFLSQKPASEMTMVSLDCDYTIVTAESKTSISFRNVQVKERVG